MNKKTKDHYIAKKLLKLEVEMITLQQILQDKGIFTEDEFAELEKHIAEITKDYYNQKYWEEENNG